MPSNRLVLAAVLLILGSSARAQEAAPSAGQAYGPEPAAQTYGPEPAGEPTPAYQYRQSPAGAPAPLPTSPPLPNTAPAAPSLWGAEPAGPAPLPPDAVPVPPPVPPAVPPPVQQPASSTASESIWTALQKGRQLVRSGEARQALLFIQQFIAADPLEPEGYFWQGVALDNLQQFDQALLAYGKALTQSTKAGMDSAELRMNVGNVLLKQGKLAESIAQYKRAAEIDPALALVQLNWGRALLQQKDTAGALACFQRCDELHFQPAQLQYYRAKALLQDGRIEEARLQVRNALTKLPPETNDSVTQKIKQEFAELLKTQRDAAFSPH